MFESKKRLTYFMKINNVKFKQQVLPGDTLIFDLKLMAPIRRGIVLMNGQAIVGDKKVINIYCIEKYRSYYFIK